MKYGSTDKSKLIQILLYVILAILTAILAGLLLLASIQPKQKPFIDYPEEWQAAKVGDTLEVVKGNDDSLFIQFKLKHR